MNIYFIYHLLILNQLNLDFLDRTAVFLAIIITITYTINTADDDASDGSKSIITTTNSPLSPSQIDDVITTLIAIEWPLLGKKTNISNNHFSNT
jgi:hypothetical protein